MRVRDRAAAGYGLQSVDVLLAGAARIWTTWGASERDTARTVLPLPRGTRAAVGAAALVSVRQIYAGTVPLTEGRGAIDAAIANRLRALLCSST